MATNNDAPDVIEIDLVGAIAPIASRWKHVLLVLVLAVAGRAALVVAGPQSFTAASMLTIVKTRTEVQFDPRIKTSQPDDFSTLLADYRRNALATMVMSPRIAARALQKFADRLPAESTAASILEKVSDEIEPRNDILKIMVTMPDAKLAADIATFWAHELENEANAVLSGVTPEYVAEIDAELLRATNELDVAQSNVVAAMQESRADTLRLVVNQKVREMDRLEALRLAPVLSSLQRKQSSLGAVASIGESQERVRQLHTLASAMKIHLQKGGAAAAATNVIPLMNLKLQVYAIVSTRSTSLAQLDLTTSSVDRSRVNEQRANVDQQALGTIYGSNMNFQVPPDALVVTTAEQQMQDVDAMVATLSDLDEQLSKDLQNAISPQDVVNAPAPANSAEINAQIDKVVDELRRARADLESESFRLTQLGAKRDTLRDTVQALRAKRAEVDVSVGVGNSYVRMTSEALVPIVASVSLARTLAVAAGVGLAVGIFLALVLAIRAGDYRRRPTAA